MIRVFPKRMKWTPEDPLAFIGEPPASEWLPEQQPVCISVAFQRDCKKAEKLFPLWKMLYPNTRLGGPAYGDKGNEFVPGRFIKHGVTITSRGCPNKCPWCFVWGREGRKIRELPVVRGHIIQDNNLLACSDPHIDSVFSMLRACDQPAKFAGGFDIRLFNERHRRLLDTIKLGEVWFAYDSKALLSPLKRTASLLKGIRRGKRRCYVLVAFNGETLDEANSRVRQVYDLGFDPFAQFYQGPGEQEETDEWKVFCRTWSRPAGYRTVMKKEKE